MTTEGSILGFRVFFSATTGMLRAARQENDSKGVNPLIKSQEVKDVE